MKSLNINIYSHFRSLRCLDMEYTNVRATEKACSNVMGRHTVAKQNEFVVHCPLPVYFTRTGLSCSHFFICFLKTVINQYFFNFTLFLTCLSVKYFMLQPLFKGIYSSLPRSRHFSSVPH